MIPRLYGTNAKYVYPVIIHNYVTCIFLVHPKPAFQFVFKGLQLFWQAIVNAALNVIAICNRRCMIKVKGMLPLCYILYNIKVKGTSPLYYKAKQILPRIVSTKSWRHTVSPNSTLLNRIFVVSRIHNRLPAHLGGWATMDPSLSIQGGGCLRPSLDPRTHVDRKCEK